MTKGILNYTTTVEAAKTISEIQSVLQSHGARSILMTYAQNGEVEALAFEVDTLQSRVPIRLPVNVDAVVKILKRQRDNSPRLKYRTQTDDEILRMRQQAIRVAWRILKDWVEAQMALLETEMVKMEQIFLPYMETPNGQTVFERLQGQQFMQLPEGERRP